MPRTTTYDDPRKFDRALKRLPGNIEAEVSEATILGARDVAARASRNARAVGGVAKLLAGAVTVITTEDGAVITVEGSRRLPHGRGTLEDVTYGAERGGGRRPETRQFRPYVGDVGYFLAPAMREEEESIAERWDDALLDALVETR